jgi:hypothetical protein
MWADVYFFKNRLAAKSAESWRAAVAAAAYQSATWRRGEQSAQFAHQPAPPERKKEVKFLVFEQRVD